VLDPNHSKLCIRDGWWLGNDPEASLPNMYFELSAAIERFKGILDLVVKASLSRSRNGQRQLNHSRGPS
jgi:hypothetical protein